MIERINHDRQKLIRDYKVIFESLPQLKYLALDYWKQTEGLSPNDPYVLEGEDFIFSSTVLEMANILLEDDNFQKAMSKMNANQEESAIIESVMMIEVVLDIEEENKNKMQ